MMKPVGFVLNRLAWYQTRRFCHKPVDQFKPVGHQTGQTDHFRFDWFLKLGLPLVTAGDDDDH
jgi:hypothetical protein